MPNLNEIQCGNDMEESKLSIRPTRHDGNGYSLHFDDIVDVLVDEISGAGAMIACVAWLTHPELLRAASRIPASFLVQKEDFLRPDSQRMSNGKLRVLYETGPKLERYWFGVVGDLSSSGDFGLDRVRCVGMSVEGDRTIPRMHHKFAVFGDWDEGGPDPDFGRFIPKSVATGSFNWTHNATTSLENVMIIRNREIARHYAREWAHVLTLSEPCNWESEYVAPEWRIGT